MYFMDKIKRINSLNTDRIKRIEVTYKVFKREITTEESILQAMRNMMRLLYYKSLAFNQIYSAITVFC